MSRKMSNPFSQNNNASAYTTREFLTEKNMTAVSHCILSPFFYFQDSKLRSKDNNCEISTRKKKIW